jgi:endonuclease III-like uncharacterized protein
MVQGAYINTLFRDNIRILFTKNIGETVTLLLSIAIKMIEHPKKFAMISEVSQGTCQGTCQDTCQDTNQASQLSTQPVYTDFIKLKKKKIDNIDINTCYIMQLSQIPHISNVIAKNIAKIYPNMIELITKLNDCEDKIKELCKIDGVGKEKAGTVIKYLFSQ